MNISLTDFKGLTKEITLIELPTIKLKIIIDIYNGSTFYLVSTSNNLDIDSYDKIAYTVKTLEEALNKIKEIQNRK